MEESEFEKDIWQRAEKFYSEADKKCEVCAYPQDESQLPMYMEKYGFRDVTTEYIVVNLTPDNPIYSKEMAYAMINANRQVALDSADRLLHISANDISSSEVEELKTLINSKYDKRIALYDDGIKQWDTNVSVTMIVRGLK